MKKKTSDAKLQLDKRTRVLKIIELLEKEYPEAKTALKYRSPLELLVATILLSRQKPVLEYHSLRCHSNQLLE